MKRCLLKQRSPSTRRTLQALERSRPLSEAHDASNIIISTCLNGAAVPCSIGVDPRKGLSSSLTGIMKAQPSSYVTGCGFGTVQRRFRFCCTDGCFEGAQKRTRGAHKRPKGAQGKPKGPRKGEGGQDKPKVAHLRGLEGGRAFRQSSDNA